MKNTQSHPCRCDRFNRSDWHSGQHIISGTIPSLGGSVNPKRYFSRKVAPKAYSTIPCGGWLFRTAHISDQNCSLQFIRSVLPPIGLQERLFSLARVQTMPSLYGAGRRNISGHGRDRRLHPGRVKAGGRRHGISRIRPDDRRLQVAYPDPTACW